ncbi:hypothetical protein [Phytomonospora endophytica]|uniref:Tetratricopeptide (TPR) repeat protein n=1 Tax=Phytomonospora endophytica TaxID=714109 RepID=A0A841FJ13_9ACTN|nr:hypothetical protein [Phytomonospora endophytica]MBB6035864.1 tetratricopeptide (TPR) repeat protein [Phytomonospora endophytica]GIG71141.1 hypothetical protein Pen01_74360 [Phytomonospora endophytica]
MPVWPVRDPQSETPSRLPQLVAPPAWLPGRTQVDVVGESFRQDSIQRAVRDREPNGLLIGVLVPAPPFAEYPEAVAVYVQTHHVGYLAKDIARQVHPMLLRFALANSGRLPACPAQVEDSDLGLWVTLSIDPAPLGLSPELFGSSTTIAAVLDGLLHRLDQPQPYLSGLHPAARAALEVAERSCEEVDADYDRSPKAWPRLERNVRGILDELIKASDPWISRAWLALARTTRYQKGRRDDTLRAYVESVYCDRSGAEAARELLAYVAIAPTVPMFVSLYRRLPPALRVAVLPTLLGVSRGYDRYGNMDPGEGELLRSALATLATDEGDNGTLAALAADAGLRAEKGGDLRTAVARYREAVAAGSTDPGVADRYSIWLVKEGDFAEAAAVLRQALAVPDQSGTRRERMAKRLNRCARSAGDVGSQRVT